MKGITNANSGLWEQGITTDKYKDQSVTTAKIADENVTRAKLNRDALYSPIKYMNGGEYSISADDLGKTIVSDRSYVGDFQINMPNDVASDMPLGAEIAIFHNASGVLQLTCGSKVHSVILGVSEYQNSKSYIIPDKFGMLAMKKIREYGEGELSTEWIITGNVEVVEVEQ